MRRVTYRRRHAPKADVIDADVLEAYLHKNALSRADASRLKRQLRKLARA